MTFGIRLVVEAVVALLASWAVVGVVRRRGAKRLLDLPNERSSHSVPVPRGGGIGIAVVTLVGWGVGAALGLDPARLAGLAVAALLVAAISFYDDLRTVGTGVRFLVHTLAGGVGIYAMGVPTSLDLGAGPWAVAPSVAIVLALFWTVALTNIYNFMDGIDGIAGVQAVAAGVGWLCVGLATGASALALSGVLLAASSAGFLLHNWPPARIFMGDVGSAFLGFSFATLLLLSEPVLGGKAWVTALLMVWPFAFDGTYTLLRRAARGENVLKAHRSHLYQRQVVAGRSHQSVTLRYGVAAAVSAAAAGYWALHKPHGVLISGGLALGVAAYLWADTLFAERRPADLP